MENPKKRLYSILNHFEEYIASGLFIIITVLLFIQVVSRYLSGYAIVWAEEMAVQLLVIMVYLSIPAAVTHRRHITIDSLIEVVGFKTKKIILIIGNLIFFAFCIWIQKPMIDLFQQLGSSVFPILQFEKKYIYVMIPIGLGLTAIRIIQNILRIWKENESSLGKSKPTIDIEACEREYEDRKRQNNAIGGDL